MPSYGLLPEGFVPKTREVIQAELEAAFKAAFGGDNFDVSPQTPAGQVIGIIADREAIMWELLEIIAHMMDPDGATGALLDFICALTGTTRLPASPSEVVLTLTGDDGTSVPTGSQASTSDTEEKFETIEDATIATVAVWAAGAPYALGERASNDTPIRVYQVITPGTSAGSGGPTGTNDDITDNTVHWRYVGDGEGAADADAESVNDGAIQADAGTITVIETPVSGWSSVRNMADADLGRELETDPELRLRRLEELQAGANATANAIRSRLLKVDDVTVVKLFINDTDVTDPDGVPPHAVEALVLGGDDQDIVDALGESVAAGIATYGTDSGTWTDSDGVDHTINFSRPDEVPIYIDVFVTIDANTYPTDGDQQIKDAIVAGPYVGIIGRDAVASAIKARCFTVVGVLDATQAQIDDAPAPSTETTVVITSRQLATYDTGNITVTTTPGTP